MDFVSPDDEIQHHDYQKIRHVSADEMQGSLHTFQEVQTPTCHLLLPWQDHEEEPQEKPRLWDIPKDNWPEALNMSGRGGERQETAESYNTLKTQAI